MAHESFEDADIAAQLNADFVAIKVDREERPDIDAVYMAATQAMTGQGGWPMTCFLTPDGRAVLLRHVLPDAPQASAFRSSSTPWRGLARGRRAGARRGRADRGQARRRRGGDPARRGRRRRRASPPPSTRCARSSTRGSGGFGGAPEVPAVDGAGVPAAPPRAHRLGHRAGAWPSATCERDGPRRDVRPARRRVRALQRRRALGGAALREDALRQRAAAARSTRTCTGSPARRSPCAWPTRPPPSCCATCGTAEGGFAVGARRRHRRRRGLDLRLDARPARRGARRRGRRLGGASCSRSPTAGTFEHGASTLQLAADPDDPARWDRVRAALLAARAARPQPARDDKVVTAWNGLAIAALAEGGAALDRPDVGRRRRAGRRPAAGRATSSTDGCAAPRATAWSARRRACWRTTPRWPTACSRCTRPPARRAGSRPRRELLDVALAHFVDRTTAPSSTPPTTPRRCCTGPARSPTTRRRAAAPRWPRRCSPRRC